MYGLEWFSMVKPDLAWFSLVYHIVHHVSTWFGMVKRMLCLFSIDKHIVWVKRLLRHATAILGISYHIV